MDLASIVDLERYPIDRPGSAAHAAALALASSGLERDGCSVLEGFAAPGALAAMAAEADRLRRGAHPVDEPWYPYPPYHAAGEGDWPEGHPRVHRQRRRNRFVAYDLLAADSILRALYEHPAMTAFVTAVLGEDELHPYGDPLGACVLSIQEEGEALPWHFDLTHFVVSLSIRAAGEGGRFHYAPRLACETDRNYEGVARLLAGGGAYVDLDLKPGALQLFEGRHSMHRVTAPGPGDWRCAALLSYCEKPGVIGGGAMQRSLFGRTDRRTTRWRNGGVARRADDRA